MSFEDDTTTELKEFFSSKIDKILTTKLERLDKLDEVFEEVSLIRLENKELREQNTKLTQQLATLNTTLQGFCSKAGSELEELREGQAHLQNMINEEAQQQVNNKQTEKVSRDELATSKPSKGTKDIPVTYQNSQTALDNPNRVLTPLESNQLDISVKEQTI
ncbi:hypothetical protein LOD99_13921 [Oopsacas minuta]|uniref:Uncharacterized protein n=1 Tax=Oopsacas minuta TaxID=111878 RepID=A0AAV7KGS1_9METZ|nr:hypothetical protein LOD99_13921 [Oopsacas minuta]